MMNKKALEAVMDRMKDALSDMDEVSDCEESDDFCAEIEDTLFFIESMDAEEEDDAQEITDTLEELAEMLESCGGSTEFRAKAKVLENLVRIAAEN